MKGLTLKPLAQCRNNQFQFIYFTAFGKGTIIVNILLDYPKQQKRCTEKLLYFPSQSTAPQERRYPIFVALERGLDVSMEANIQPTVIESQI